MDPLKMYILLNMGIFHCYVSLPEITWNSGQITIHEFHGSTSLQPLKKEAMEVHRQLVQARRNDEDAQLRQAQDQEPRRSSNLKIMASQPTLPLTYHPPRPY